MAKGGPLDSFGTVLSGLAKRLGLESRLVELRLQHRWGALVGEPIASHTWPDQIRFKKLYLIVQNSVWLQQLTFMKPALLSAIHAETGTNLVADIVLRVGEVPSPDRRSAPSAPFDPQPASNPAALAEASAYASAVQDPELRARLTHVMAEALSRSDRP